ncbi:phospholipid scramblase 1 [Orbilia ellipsospora]|uniref:Phospholipid scramblase 1 n=1 Tax=Orbilia ellipsospora TaxID=2528407 RepID=A0AAV9WR18_9PEZI
MRVHGWLLFICAVDTLILGLVIWFNTLDEITLISKAWDDVGPLVQTLLQEKFDCCGYLSHMQPMFDPDETCLDALVSSEAIGCRDPIIAFLDEFYKTIFTLLFGVVALDVVMFCFAAMVLEHRKVVRRWKRIDAKNAQTI